MEDFVYFNKLQQLCVKAKLHPQFGDFIQSLSHEEAEQKCKAVFTEMVQAYQTTKATITSLDQLPQLADELKTLLRQKLEGV
jgi:hypothetical protein